MIFTAWNLSKVTAALGRFSVIPLMKAGLMSIQTSSIASGSPPCAARSSAKAATVSASLPSVANSTRALVDIDEQRDVVVAAPRGGLIDGDVGHLRGVHSRPRLIDVVVNDAPQPGVVLADDAGHRGHRHGRNHGHDQRLEQQGEAAVRA